MRKLQVRRPTPPADAIDTVAAVTHTNAEALRQEVSSFRLALDADLSVAAAALDADAPDIASDVLGGNRDELDALSHRLLHHLSDAPRVEISRASRPARTGRVRWVKLPAAAAFAAATALIGGVSGAVIATTGADRAPDASSGTLNAAQQEGALELAAQEHLSSRTIAAQAAAVNASLRPLLAAARSNPRTASEVAMLLTNEEAVLSASNPDGSSDLLNSALAQTDALLAQLQATVTGTVLAVLPSLGQGVTGSTSSHPLLPTPTDTAFGYPSMASTPTAVMTPSRRPVHSATGSPAPTTSPSTSTTPSAPSSPSPSGAPTLLPVPGNLR